MVRTRDEGQDVFLERRHIKGGIREGAFEQCRTDFAALHQLGDAAPALDPHVQFDARKRAPEPRELRASRFAFDCSQFFPSNCSITSSTG